MPIDPAAVSIEFRNRSGRLRLSLLDTDFGELVDYLNDVINYSNYLVDSGIADAYEVDFDGGLSFTLAAGQFIPVQFAAANTGACTITVNGGTAKAIKMQDNTDPPANTISAGGIYGLVYDGTKWQIIGIGGVAALAAGLPAALAAIDVPQTMWIPASAMFPSISPLTPPDAFAVIRNQGGGTEATIPQVVNVGLAIGGSVQFQVFFPKGWDGGTIKFKPIWTIPTAGAVTGTKAKFQLQGVSNSNNEAIDDNFGTAIGVEQTTVAPAGFKLYVGSQSAALTIAGSPAYGDLCFFKLERVAASSSDITDDLTLLGIELIYTAALSDA